MVVELQFVLKPINAIGLLAETKVYRLLMCVFYCYYLQNGQLFPRIDEKTINHID